MLVGNKNIIFFDGHCNLCNSFVNFVVSRDRGRKLYVASIQGQAGSQYLTTKEIQHISTVIFKDTTGKKYYKSAAVLKILWHLGGLYKVLSHFSLLPQFFTDGCYDLIAKNRYHIFGKEEVCRLPGEDEKDFFLD